MEEEKECERSVREKADAFILKTVGISIPITIFTILILSFSDAVLHKQPWALDDRIVVCVVGSAGAMVGYLFYRKNGKS